MTSQALAASLALCDTLAGFDTATLWEVNQGGSLVGVRPLTVDARVAGPALTVACPPGDNLAIHIAVARARPGEVLVVQSGDAAYGVWGEVLTVAAMARGLKALVLDGSVRDVDSIRERGFPVYARGTALVGTTKAHAGVVGVPISCGGQLVFPGDVIVADASGVVAIRALAAAGVASRAEARKVKEEAIMRDLEGGRTTIDLLGLQETIDRLGAEGA